MLLLSVNYSDVSLIFTNVNKLKRKIQGEKKCALHSSESYFHLAGGHSCHFNDNAEDTWVWQNYLSIFITERSYEDKIQMPLLNCYLLRLYRNDLLIARLSPILLAFLLFLRMTVCHSKISLQRLTNRLVSPKLLHILVVLSAAVHESIELYFLIMLI